MKVMGYQGNKCGIVKLGNSLKAQREFVGGNLERLSIGNGLNLICNEEGKLLHLVPTVAWLDNGKLKDIVHGNCFVCREKEGKFISLNDADIPTLKGKLIPFLNNHSI